MFRHRPAMKWCVPFICGAALGWHFTISLAFLFWLTASLLVAALALRLSMRVRSWLAAVDVLLLIAFGALKATFDAASPSDDIARFNDVQAPATLLGVAQERPALSDWSMRLPVEAKRIAFGDSALEVSGTIVLSCSRRSLVPSIVDSIFPGKIVRVRGILSAPPPPRNPGEFDMRSYYRMNGISSRFLADVMDSASLGPTVSLPFVASIVDPVREHASSAIDSIIGGEEGNFLKGLLLGERSTIPLEVKNEFINAGVMHILAVSGLHVAIVSMILLIIFQSMRLPHPAAIGLTVATLVYYNFLTGGTASVTRSVVMASVFLCGKLLERKSDMYNTLGVSALVIMLADSRQLFQAGFQLSFVAVFSLVYLYPKIEGLKKFVPERIGRFAGMQWLSGALTVTLAAGIGTLPFTALYFGKVSLIGFAANLIAVPLSNVILAVGMLAVGVWFVIPWLGVVYAMATYGLTRIFLDLIAYFGTMPHGFVQMRMNVWSAIMFYCSIGLLIGMSDPKRRFVSAIVLLFVCVYFAWKPIVAPERPLLRITVIDCGQGDALLLELPHGRNILIDGGPKTTTSDAGVRFIVPYLRWRGIDRLSAVITTHPHSDHNGGIPAVLRALRVDSLYDGGESPETDIDSLYEHLVDSLGISRRVVRQGERLACDPSVALYVLHPTDLDVRSDHGEKIALNNASLVVKAVYERTSILLTGDMERPVEHRLVRRYGDFLRSDILKAGHHGSITSSSEEFLTAVRPSTALISVGANNKFGHPSPGIIARYRADGIAFLRTDRDGAIVAESDGEAWQFPAWR